MSYREPRLKSWKENNGSMTLKADYYPRIDYSSHPAFRHLAVPARNEDAQVEEFVARIDDRLEQLQAEASAPPEQFVASFERGPGAEMDRLGEHLRSTKTNERIASWLSRSLRDARQELLTEALVKRQRTIEQFRSKSSLGREVAARLSIDGMYACHLDEPVLKEIRAINAPFVESLRERGRKQRTGRLVQDYWQHSRTSNLLERFFTRNGIVDGLSEYFGSSVRFEGFALEYSFAGQHWWRGVYADVGLPISRTNYFHYDHGCKYPKAIVALSDVGPDNGPTGFIRGSTTRPRSTFLHFFMKSLDFTFESDPAVSVEPSYFRPQFSCERYRREFMQLPRVLQGTSHFGEDIEDGTELSEELLRDEVRLTRDVGNCIVFDGDYGIHRGGIVADGERFVFQVIFAVAQSLPPITNIANRARGYVRRLRYGEGPVMS